MAWSDKNLAAFEHLGFINPDQDAAMETLMAANAARESKRLSQESFYRSILHRFVSTGQMTNIHDDAYVDKWYDVCRRIFTSMS